MATVTLKLAEEKLKQEVLKLDKRVQVAAVITGKKKGTYRVTLVRDGKSGTTDLDKTLIAESLEQEAKAHTLRRALGKAVSRLTLHSGR